MHRVHVHVHAHVHVHTHVHIHTHIHVHVHVCVCVCVLVVRVLGHRWVPKADGRSRRSASRNKTNCVCETTRIVSIRSKAIP